MSIRAKEQAEAILAAILIIMHCINASLVGVVLLVVIEDIVYIRHSHFQILTLISEGIQHTIVCFRLKKVASTMSPVSLYIWLSVYLKQL